MFNLYFENYAGKYKLSSDSSEFFSFAYFTEARKTCSEIEICLPINLKEHQEAQKGMVLTLGSFNTVMQYNRFNLNPCLVELTLSMRLFKRMVARLKKIGRPQRELGVYNILALCILLAHKYINDMPYSNKQFLHHAKCSKKIALTEYNKMELQLFQLLDSNVGIRNDERDEFISEVEYFATLIQMQVTKNSNRREEQNEGTETVDASPEKPFSPETVLNCIQNVKGKGMKRKRTAGVEGKEKEKGKGKEPEEIDEEVLNQSAVKFKR